MCSAGHPSLSVVAAVVVAVCHCWEKIVEAVMSWHFRHVAENQCIFCLFILNEKYALHPMNWPQSAVFLPMNLFALVLTAMRWKWQQPAGRIVLRC
jgi:hypothetical protein